MLDAAGVRRAPVLGWSMGVNTMFELALRHPERVSGLFAVAGVPGGTFATMLAPTRLPRPVRKAVTVGLSRGMRLLGPLVTPVSSRLPVGPLLTRLLSHSGFMLPVAEPELTARALRAYLQTPVDWYFHLALHSHRHKKISLSRIEVPSVFVAATWDLLSGPREMRSAVAHLPDATYVELSGSHFVQMEKPALVHAELLTFLQRLEPQG